MEIIIIRVIKYVYINKTRHRGFSVKISGTIHFCLQKSSEWFTVELSRSVPVCPCDGHVISQNGNMVVIEEGKIRIHSLSQDKGLSRNFTHACVFSSGEIACIINARPLSNVSVPIIVSYFFRQLSKLLVPQLLDLT